MGEHKFCKALHSILGEHFGYQVDLSPDQFVQQGFGERKLILVLDVYDIVKQVRKQSKVHKRLAQVDRQWEHPCDQALKQYSVCDHTEHLLKDI